MSSRPITVVKELYDQQIPPSIMPVSFHLNGKPGLVLKLAVGHYRVSPTPKEIHCTRVNGTACGQQVVEKAGIRVKQAQNLIGRCISLRNISGYSY